MSEVNTRRGGMGDSLELLVNHASIAVRKYQCAFDPKGDVYLPGSTLGWTGPCECNREDEGSVGEGYAWIDAWAYSGTVIGQSGRHARGDAYK